MRLGIAAKLFFLLLATTITISIVMSVATRLSFRSGFLGYLNEQGTARVETLVPAFAAAYKVHGSWDYLRDDLRVWIEFLRTTSRPANSPDLASIHLRMMLLDAEKHYLVGYQKDLGADPVIRPIVVDGKTVGYLGLRSQQSMLSDADVRFQHRQLISAWVIGASVVLLASLVAFQLSRTLVTPLQRIAGATKQLANGNYATRVTLASKDEIGELSNDFNELADTLKRNEQLRRDFMADIAHELRTPLSVLRGELEAIQDKVASPTPEAIDSLHSEVATLSKVVDDLYELSLADVGALNYRKTFADVGDILRTTLDAFLHRFESLGLKVETHIDEGANANVDPQRIQQLCNNLLENMARYTQAPGQLKIECRHIPNESPNVTLHFHNSGPGLPDEHIAQMFDRFFRFESKDSNSRAFNSGAGLGLAICRKIVEAHGGEIGARHSPLGGILIEVRLPAQNGRLVAS